MPSSLGPALPPPLVELLDGRRLNEKLGLVIQCCTVDAEGWPILAMISVGELLAVSARELRLAIWSHATTPRRLADRGRCTLALVHDGAGYLILSEARALGSLTVSEGQAPRAFGLTVRDVQRDVAPYATLTSGITYTLHDPGVVVARWEETLGRLRCIASPC